MDQLPKNEFRVVIFAGGALAANAGYINAVTMAGLFANTVSHVTGNLTKIPVLLFLGQLPLSLRYLKRS